MLLYAAPALGGERLVQVWTEADGLPANQVVGADQAPDGAIWFGSVVGPVRYDGVRFQVHPPRHPTRGTLFGAERLAIPLFRQDPVWSIDRDAPLLREGEPVNNVRAAWVEGERLWIGQGGDVIRRDGDSWATLLQSDRLIHGIERIGEELYAFGDGGAWRLEPEPVEQVSSLHGLRAWLPFGGEILTADTDGRVLALEDGVPRVLAADLGYPGNAVLRDGVAWFAFDRTLVRIDPDRTAEELTVEGLGGLGRIRVDREGDLWITGTRGVGRMPEPETVLWSIDDGVPTAPVAKLSRTPGVLWVVTRGETVPFDPERRTFGPPDRTIKSAGVCVDDEGVAWSGGALAKPFIHVLARGVGPTEAHYPIAGDTDFWGCATWEGTAWLATGSGLYRGGDPPLLVGALPPANPDGGSVGFKPGPDGRWWAWEGSQVCHHEPAPAPRAVDWTCTRAPGPVHSLAWTDGDLYAAGEGSVYRYASASWAEVLSDRDPDLGIAASPRGGFWLLEVGSLSRRDRRGAVVERLGRGHGILDGAPLALLEDPDGTVWIGSRTGLTRVPARVRSWTPEVPEVAWIEATVDGAPQPLDAPFTLPYAQNRLSAVVAAQAFRDPERLRYRISVNGEPQPVSPDNRFRFLGLAPGAYRLEVAASLDGERWSTDPAALKFRVQWPLWAQWWALLGYALALGSIAFAIYRARVGYLIGLERQRARIALDLHDEVGSGLGSIGLIAGALSQGEDAASAAAAETIAATTAELGEALTDIVWALRPDSERPEALLAFLSQRGRALASGANLRFGVVHPDPWPRTALSLPARRNLSAIALEAMHNAAKYSGGSSLTLGLEEGSPSWRLWVSDDGQGIDPDAPIRPGGGVGLEGMRRRAADIGAELEVHSGPEGTTISVRFRPDAEDRRLR